MAEQNLRNSLTAEQLRAVIIYDPETGAFMWRHRADMPKEWNVRWAGKPAGSRRPGSYTAITVYHINYRAHRLAWLYMTGKWPLSGEVDHEDTDKGNNVWANLRDSTRRQNSSNTRIRSTNTSGFKGVSRHQNRWVATITANYHQMYLGIFDTKEEAREAYMAAAERLHGEFARIG
jgi:hypothetical protein